MQRQLVKDLLKEKLQRELKVKKLNAKLQDRFLDALDNPKEVRHAHIGLQNLET